MKDFEILAEMCTAVIKLLKQQYESGNITKETYDEHLKLKLQFLQSIKGFSVNEE